MVWAVLPSLVFIFTLGPARRQRIGRAVANNKWFQACSLGQVFSIPSACFHVALSTAARMTEGVVLAVGMSKIARRYGGRRLIWLRF